jgi:hypothetical protein
LKARRALVVAAVAGIAVGTAGAIAAGDSGGPPARHLSIGPPIGAEDRLPDGRYDAGRVHLVVDRPSVRVDVRIADPDGGPDWAMRTYTGERRSLRRPARTLAHPASRQRVRCAQLGRIVDGRFGWIFPGERFRAVDPARLSQLTACTSARRTRPLIMSGSPLVIAPDGAARIERAVLWGIAPAGTRDPRVTGQPVAASAIGRGGAVLVLGPAGSTVGNAAVTAVAPDGRRGSLISRPPRLPGLHQVRATNPTVEARVPDPAGGPPWAVLVGDTPGGGTCVIGTGRVVGDHVGGIDGSEGIFSDVARNPDGCSQSIALTHSRPIDLGFGFANTDPERKGLFDDRARVERRLQPGRTAITVRCSPDVRSVTVSTPRDTRVLVPSAHGHVVFAVYDGDFTSGDIVVTATLRDGSHHRQTLPAAF